MEPIIAMTTFTLINFDIYRYICQVVSQPIERFLTQCQIFSGRRILFGWFYSLVLILGSNLLFLGRCVYIPNSIEVGQNSMLFFLSLAYVRAFLYNSKCARSKTFARAALRSLFFAVLVDSSFAEIQSRFWSDAAKYDASNTEAIASLLVFWETSIKAK